MKKKSIATLALLLVMALFTAWLESNNSSSSNDRGIRSTHNTNEYVLAVSWQPAFCETRPNKPECRSQRKGRFDANHFSLHGLWPQPVSNVYCGVGSSLKSTDKSGRWRDLPKLDLSQALRKELAQKMPGYRSFLHRHEWIKHGTCMNGSTPEEYFRISLNLLDQINTSQLQSLFSNRLGEEIRFREMAQAANRSFGKGAGERIEMDCYRLPARRIIGQLEFALSGDLSERSQLSELMKNAKREPRSCPAGIVDQVGKQ